MSVEANALSSTVDHIAAVAMNAMYKLHFMSTSFNDYYSYLFIIQYRILYNKSAIME